MTERKLEQTAIDVAGAKKGGAARFLREMDTYLGESDLSPRIVGRGNALTPGWLVKRELRTRGYRLRIALNNAGFVSPGSRNITLLRNILHFAEQEDLARLAFEPSFDLRLQTPVIRQLARRSDVIVVPCTRMGEQVGKVAPYLLEKMVVRFHPVTMPGWAGSSPLRPLHVLMPIVPSPYKKLHEHVPEFLEASRDLGVRLVIPAGPEVLPDLADHPRIDFVGYQSSENLEFWWRECAAVFFPVEFEAFGYPLAEARVYGRPVIAQQTKQNAEIAGPALRGYKRGDAESLTAAIELATHTVSLPDPGPFDPSSYFAWLFGGALASGASVVTPK